MTSINNPKISIIVPVYNISKYLRKALNSITRQSFDDFELICVDDASTDNSLSILQEFAEKDSRVIILSEKETRGQSYTRNKALSIAKGEYICFIDGDDWVDSELLEKLYFNAISNDSDIVLCEAKVFDDTAQKLVENKYYSLDVFDKTFDQKVFEPKDTIDFVLNINVALWAKLYNKNFIKKLDVKLKEGYIYEDLLFFFETFLKAKKISILRESLYIYRINRKDSTMQSSDHKLLDRVDMVMQTYDVLKNWVCFEDIQIEAASWLIDDLSKKFLSVDIQYQEEFFYKLKKAFLDLKIDSIYTQVLSKSFYPALFEIVTKQSYDECVKFVFSRYETANEIEQGLIYNQKRELEQLRIYFQQERLNDLESFEKKLEKLRTECEYRLSEEIKHKENEVDSVRQYYENHLKERLDDQKNWYETLNNNVVNELNIKYQGILDYKEKETQRWYDNLISQRLEEFEKIKQESSIWYESLLSQKEEEFEKTKQEISDWYKSVLFQKEEEFEKSKQEMLNWHESDLKQKTEELKAWYENEMSNRIESQRQYLTDDKHKALFDQKLQMEEQRNKEVENSKNALKMEMDYRLASQAQWYEDEMQKRIKECEEWHNNNLNERLDNLEKAYESQIIDLRSGYEKVKQVELSLQHEKDEKAKQVELSLQKEKDEKTRRIELALQQEYHERELAQVKFVLNLVKKLKNLKLKIKKSFSKQQPNNLSIKEHFGPKISVILPIYNVDRYIRQCLDSLVNQTFTDIEIICVDDGSTDDSGLICDEYAQKDKRIKVIHKSNSGTGAARNDGLKIATGECIAFVDPDDWIRENMFERLYSLLKAKDVDIVMCTPGGFNEEKQLEEDFPYFVDSNFSKSLDNRIFNWQDISPFSYPMCVWNKLYKKKLFDDNDIDFAEGLDFEDHKVIFKSLLTAKRMFFIREKLYIYRFNRQGSILSDNNRRLIDHIQIFDIVENILRETNTMELLRKDFLVYKAHNLFYYYGMIKKEFKKEYFEKMRQSIKDTNLSMDEKEFLLEKYPLMREVLYDIHENYDFD